MRTLSEISETVLTNAQNQTTNFLTKAESVELISLEATVERGLRAFWEIGQALCKIRDRHLYRENYSTFEEYCLNRWEMCRRSADRLIAAASVYEKFETHGSQILPANERQVRPLTALPPEQQIPAWNQVVSTAPKGKITSTHVAQVVKEYKLAIKSDRSDSNKNSLSQPNKQHTFETGEEQNQRGNPTRSCWNCRHCSGEMIKNEPHSFFCYQLGKLNFIEKDANQRGTECELWVDRFEESAKEKTINIPKKETFTLTLQLPAHWQPLMKDAAKTEELVLVDWAIKVLEKALNSFEFDSNEILTTKDFLDGSTKLPERDAVISEIISEKTAA